MDKLTSYHWPGNVRELISTLRRAIIMSENGVIAPADFSFDSEGFIEKSNETTYSTNPDGKSLNRRITDKAKAKAKPCSYSAQDLRNVLTKNAYNITRTSKELNVSRVTMYKMLKRHNISRYSNDQAR